MRLFEISARDLYKQTSRQQRLQARSADLPEVDPESYKFPNTNTSLDTNYGVYKFFKKSNSWISPDNQPVKNQKNIQKLNLLWAEKSDSEKPAAPTSAAPTTKPTAAPTTSSATAAKPPATPTPATPAPATKFKTPEEMVDAILALAPPNWLPTITAELLKKQSVAGRKK